VCLKQRTREHIARKRGDEAEGWRKLDKDAAFLSYCEAVKVKTGAMVETRSTHGFVCEISSSHGGEYDVQSCLLGYTAV
jgi:hypothetical protein